MRFRRPANDRCQTYRQFAARCRNKASAGFVFLLMGAMLTGGLWPGVAWPQGEATPEAVGATSAPAQDLDNAQTEAADAPAPQTQPALPRQSPRATIKTFLLAMQEKRTEDAARCLDLSGIKAERRLQRGAELAPFLYEVITSRLPQIKLELYPDEPDYADADGAHRFAMTTEPDAASRIVLARDEDGQWRFASELVAELPTLYQAQTTQPAATQPAAADGVPDGLRSAQAAIWTFLTAMNAAKDDPDRIQDAIACLDLSALDPIIRKDTDRVRQRAVMLKGIMDRTREVLKDELPDDPQGPPYIFREHKAGNVVIARTDDGRWLFTAETVRDIPELYGELSTVETLKQGLEGETVFDTGELAMQAALPAWLREQFLGLQMWQWLALLVLVVIGVVLDFIIRSALGSAISTQLQRRHVRIDERVKLSALRPIGLVIMGVLWWRTLGFLLLPDDVHAMLLAAAKIVTGVAIIWTIYRVIDLIGEYMASLAAKTPSKYDDLLVPLIRRTLKISATVVGFVFLSDIFAWDLGSILAGLGIGGLALGFAAREVLQNFFGSITVLTDRPFQIGDWVKVGEHEGMVESVGFRSTRIRTFYNSLVTMPNGGLLTATVDNMGARQYRRISTKLSLTYDTPPETIDAFCEGIRELIRRHPYTRKDYFQVYFNEFDAASLNVLLYCFHDVPDWSTELRERHRLFNDILRLADRLGIAFAFPTQTIHLHQESSDRAVSGRGTPSSTSAGAARGREAARTVVEESGLGDTIPPPVSFDTTQAGESDDDGG